MMMKNWSKVREQFDRAESVYFLWLLFLNGANVGRIIARRTKNIIHVAVHIYATENYGNPIYGYARMTGWGYDRINTGIAEILVEHRDTLEDAYGITLSKSEWQIMNDWQSSFEAIGWTVVQAL